MGTDGGWAGSTCKTNRNFAETQFEKNLFDVKDTSDMETWGKGGGGSLVPGIWGTCSDAGTFCLGLDRSLMAGSPSWLSCSVTLGSRATPGRVSSRALSWAAPHSWTYWGSGSFFLLFVHSALNLAECLWLRGNERDLCHTGLSSDFPVPSRLMCTLCPLRRILSQWTPGPSGTRTLAGLPHSPAQMHGRA